MNTIVFTNDTLTIKMVTVGAEAAKHCANPTNCNDVFVTAIICVSLLLAFIIVSLFSLFWYRKKWNAEKEKDEKGTRRGGCDGTLSEKEDRDRKIKWEEEDRVRRISLEDAGTNRKKELEDRALDYIKAKMENGKYEADDPYVAEINAILGISTESKSNENKQLTENK